MSDIPYADLSRVRSTASGPVVQALSGGRLHLSHGPIDVVLQAWGDSAETQRAEATAVERFRGILSELVGELIALRKPVSEGARLWGPVATRMRSATEPFGDEFITPMAAVAGAVADELLASMHGAARLERAFVNDGGDIAVFLSPGQSMRVAVAGNFSGGPVPALNGALLLRHEDGIGGIATSGARGRSFSRGIADSVTVLAADAAAADAAATLIANAVDLDSPVIVRRPASDLDPDSDLGRILVTVAVGPLSSEEIAEALARGAAQAEGYRERGLIRAAVLMLRGEVSVVGDLPALARTDATDVAPRPQSEQPESE